MELEKKQVHSDLKLPDDNKPINAEYATPATIEDILKKGEITDKLKVKGGINQVEMIKLKDDGSGVFKAASKEKQTYRESIEAGTYYKRESGLFT